MEVDIKFCQQLDCIKQFDQKFNEFSVDLTRAKISPATRAYLEKYGVVSTYRFPQQPPSKVKEAMKFKVSDYRKFIERAPCKGALVWVPCEGKQKAKPTTNYFVVKAGGKQRADGMVRILLPAVAHFIAVIVNVQSANYDINLVARRIPRSDVVVFFETNVLAHFEGADVSQYWWDNVRVHHERVAAALAQQEAAEKAAEHGYEEGEDHRKVEPKKAKKAVKEKERRESQSKRERGYKTVYQPEPAPQEERTPRSQRRPASIRGYDYIAPESLRDDLVGAKEFSNFHALTNWNGQQPDAFTFMSPLEIFRWFDDNACNTVAQYAALDQFTHTCPFAVTPIVSVNQLLSHFRSVDGDGNLICECIDQDRYAVNIISSKLDDHDVLELRVHCPNIIFVGLPLNNAYGAVLGLFEYHNLDGELQVHGQFPYDDVRDVNPLCFLKSYRLCGIPISLRELTFFGPFVTFSLHLFPQHTEPSWVEHCQMMVQGTRQGPESDVYKPTLRYDTKWVIVSEYGAEHPYAKRFIVNWPDLAKIIVDLAVIDLNDKHMNSMMAMCTQYSQSLMTRWHWIPHNYRMDHLTLANFMSTLVVEYSAKSIAQLQINKQTIVSKIDAAKNFRNSQFGIADSGPTPSLLRNLYLPSLARLIAGSPEPDGAYNRSDEERFRKDYPVRAQAFKRFFAQMVGDYRCDASDMIYDACRVTNSPVLRVATIYERPRKPVDTGYNIRAEFDLAPVPNVPDQQAPPVPAPVVPVAQPAAPAPAPQAPPPAAVVLAPPVVNLAPPPQAVGPVRVQLPAAYPNRPVLDQDIDDACDAVDWVCLALPTVHFVLVHAQPSVRGVPAREVYSSPNNSDYCVFASISAYLNHFAHRRGRFNNAVYRFAVEEPAMFNRFYHLAVNAVNRNPAPCDSNTFDRFAQICDIPVTWIDVDQPTNDPGNRKGIVVMNHRIHGAHAVFCKTIRPARGVRIGGFSMQLEFPEHVSEALTIERSNYAPCVRLHDRGPGLIPTFPPLPIATTTVYDSRSGANATISFTERMFSNSHLPGLRNNPMNAAQRRMVEKYHEVFMSRERLAFNEQYYPRLLGGIWAAHLRKIGTRKSEILEDMFEWLSAGEPHNWSVVGFDKRKIALKPSHHNKREPTEIWDEANKKEKYRPRGITECAGLQGHGICMELVSRVDRAYFSQHDLTTVHGVPIRFVLAKGMTPLEFGHRFTTAISPGVVAVGIIGDDNIAANNGEYTESDGSAFESSNLPAIASAEIKFAKTVMRRYFSQKSTFALFYHYFYDPRVNKIQFRRYYNAYCSGVLSVFAQFLGELPSGRADTLDLNDRRNVLYSLMTIRRQMDVPRFVADNYELGLRTEVIQRSSLTELEFCSSFLVPCVSPAQWYRGIPPNTRTYTLLPKPDRVLNRQYTVHQHYSDRLPDLLLAMYQCQRFNFADAPVLSALCEWRLKATPYLTGKRVSFDSWREFDKAPIRYLPEATAIVMRYLNINLACLQALETSIRDTCIESYLECPHAPVTDPIFNLVRPKSLTDGFFPQIKAAHNAVKRGFLIRGRTPCYGSLPQGDDSPRRVKYKRNNTNWYLLLFFQIFSLVLLLVIWCLMSYITSLQEDYKYATLRSVRWEKVSERCLAKLTWEDYLQPTGYPIAGFKYPPSEKLALSESIFPKPRSPANQKLMDNDITNRTVVDDHELGDKGVVTITDVKNIAQKMLLPAATHASPVPVATGPCDQVIAKARITYGRSLNQRSLMDSTKYTCFAIQSMRGMQALAHVSTDRVQTAQSLIGTTDLAVGGGRGSNLLTSCYPIQIESSLSVLRSGTVSVRGICSYKTGTGDVAACIPAPLTSNQWLYPLTVAMATTDSMWVRVARNVPAKQNGKLYVDFYTAAKVLITTQTCTFAGGQWSESPLFTAGAAAYFIGIRIEFENPPITGRFNVAIAFTSGCLVYETYSGSAPGFYSETLKRLPLPFYNDFPVNRFGYSSASCLVKNLSPELTVSGRVCVCLLPPSSLIDDVPWSSGSLVDAISAYSGVQAFTGHLKTGAYYSVLPPPGPAVYYDDDMASARELPVVGIDTASEDNSVEFIYDVNVFGSPYGPNAKMLNWVIPGPYTAAHAAALEALVGVPRITENPKHLQMVKDALESVVRHVGPIIRSVATDPKAQALIKEGFHFALPRAMEAATIAAKGLRMVKKRKPRARRLPAPPGIELPAAAAGTFAPTVSNNVGRGGNARRRIRH